MMDPDNPVLYSGIPQEEWDNKSKYPKVLSHGPRSPNAANASRSNRGLVTFFILSLTAITISVVVVVGIRYYNFIDLMQPKNEPINDNAKVETLPQVATQEEKQQDASEGDTGEKVAQDPDSALNLNSLEGQTQNVDNEPDKEEQKKNIGTEPPPVISFTEEIPIQEEPIQEHTDEDPNEPSVYEVSKNKDDIVKYEEFFDPLQGTEAPQEKNPGNEEIYENIQNNNSEESGEEKQQEEDNLESSENAQKNENDTLAAGSEQVVYKNPNIGEIPSQNVDANKTQVETTPETKTAEELPKNENKTDSFGEIIDGFTKKYLNTSSLKSEDIQKWIETLKSQPSLEVILIASGIIFVGLSLLIIAITCIITRSRKVRRRREIISKAVNDLEGNEKVVLLTDEPSEDEYVKT